MRYNIDFFYRIYEIVYIDFSPSKHQILVVPLTTHYHFSCFAIFSAKMREKEKFQKAQKLVKKAKTLRHYGSIEECERVISKAIHKLKKAKLTSHLHLLCEAYCLRAFCLQETEPYSQVKLKLGGIIFFFIKLRNCYQIFFSLFIMRISSIYILQYRFLLSVTLSNNSTLHLNDL